MTFTKEIIIMDFDILKDKVQQIEKMFNNVLTFSSIEDMEKKQDKLIEFLKVFRDYYNEEIYKNIKTFCYEFKEKEQRKELEALKSCPYCGKEAEVKEVEDDNGDSPSTYSWKIGCDTEDCFCNLYNSSPPFSSKGDAIHAWNTRAGDEE
jgi:hypothetical protein